VLPGAAAAKRLVWSAEPLSAAALFLVFGFHGRPGVEQPSHRPYPPPVRSRKWMVTPLLREACAVDAASRHTFAYPGTFNPQT